MCQEVILHYPKQCSRCGAEVTASKSTQPYRHRAAHESEETSDYAKHFQVVDIPPIQLIVTEHQFHAALCTCCGKENQALEMAEIVSEGGYSPTVAAYIGLFSSQYRQSYRQIQKMMEAVFGIEISIGGINHLRTEVSEAISNAVTEAIGYIQQQPSLGADETGFKQRNGDGQNAAKTSGWLWVVVTPLIVCFQVILSRGTDAAKTVLGETFGGFVTSDRCPAYGWLDTGQRQLCWAHLKRDFIQISERIGVSAEIGESLLEQEEELFNLWYQFRNGQITRPELGKGVEPIRTEILSILLGADEIQLEKKDKSPLAKTVRTCRKLLKLESALWLFVREEGVEPTNNAAERAIRAAVIWRQTSFGSDSVAGSEFVSRLLTVVSSLNLQERNILDFLAESVSAARSGRTPPSLMP